MADIELQQSILALLESFQGVEPLKDLLWSKLSYSRIHQPLPRLNWPSDVSGQLAEDPLLFAAGGRNDDFHILYTRLASDQLRLGVERPVISRLLKDHPYSLFVFSNAGRDSWHFVNVKPAEGADKPAVHRRITIGPEERLRTAAQRIGLLDLADIHPDVASIAPLDIQKRHDEAFDIEPVQKAFFSKFADLYHKVADDIGQVRGMEQQAGALAQLLLDRMLFLYFIQKKGWLDGKKNYLHARFLDHWRRDPKGNSYYPDCLYPLFLCLSDPDAPCAGVGAVPFLNGGLFEEGRAQTQSQRIAEARMNVSNATFKEIFDDLLEHFNFTVSEDTPLDIEVAIDPEMLGKIFESLILQLEKDPDKDLRKLTGSYYTPREVVHFMCQEALKEYLSTPALAAGTAEVKKAREKAGALLALPPADQMDEEQLRSLRALYTEAEAKILRRAILECRVCDPAVGSGAFPVGMLHEMVAAVARLDLHLHGKDFFRRRNYDYDLKKSVIESCLYGVDIQDQAVRLCELRLWLSLVVDYELDPARAFGQAVRDVPSLPNLSYRIVRGDSLLERLFGHVVQLSEMSRDARTKQLIESVQADKQAYFREGATAEKRRLELKILAKQADLAERLVDAKKQALVKHNLSLFEETAKDRRLRELRDAQEAELEDLKERIHAARNELGRLSRDKSALGRGDLDALRRRYFHTGGHPTFIWRVDFAEVFAEKDGFDVMIANPPYVRADKGPEHLAMRAEILNCGFYETLWEKWDLYVPFIERAYKMLRPGGVLQFITSDAYCHAKYAQRSRTWFVQNALVHRIDFVSDLKIFEAGVRNVLFTYRRSDGSANAPLRMLHQKRFGETTGLPSMPQSSATHRIFLPDLHDAAADTLSETVPLHSICYISKGAVVHANERDCPGAFKLEDLVSDHKDAKHSRIFAEGKDINRWTIAQTRYIEWATKRAPARFSRPTFPELHDARPKLASLRIAGSDVRVAYDVKQVFLNHTATLFVPWHQLSNVRNRSIAKAAKYRGEAHVGPGPHREDLEALSLQFDLKYILAVMNSSWARDFLRSRRRSNTDLYPEDWKALPIVVAAKACQQRIAEKVDRILKALKDGTDIAKLEEEVDRMVAALY